MAATFNLISAETNVITCYANGTITAGDFVKAVANDDSVTSSGLSSFNNKEIKVERADNSGDEPYVIGIAGEATSTTGDLIPVYTEGVFIVRAGEAITAGIAIQKAESSDYAEVEALDDTAGEDMIGRALTSASAADAYLVILLRI